MADKDYKKMVREMFNKADINGDGILDTEEFKKFFVDVMKSTNMPRDAIQVLDETGELQEGALKKAFSKFDVNGDGEVAWDEAWQVFDNIKHELPCIPQEPHKLHKELKED